jgi:hypothetical protein
LSSRIIQCYTDSVSPTRHLINICYILYWHHTPTLLKHLHSTGRVKGVRPAFSTEKPFKSVKWDPIMTLRHVIDTPGPRILLKI